MRLLLGVIILIIAVVIWCFVQNRDHFGQDPSIRASVGWIAGPLYGYDPITRFAEQIEVMKRKIHTRCHKICRDRDSPDCYHCVREAQV